jgi:hypothetical protein
MSLIKNISPQDTGLAMVLCKLHEWEVERLRVLRSATGRQLYFSVVKSALSDNEGPMVKEVINAHHITDRALRIRLRTLVKEEYVQLDPSQSDKRFRLVRPNEVFQEEFVEHLNAAKKLLEDNYFLVEK